MIDCPFIVKIFEAFDLKPGRVFVFEYLRKGDLFSYINKHYVVKETVAWKIFTECLKGILYIHSLGIVHRDIKPENIMFGNDNHMKLIDFGLSKNNMFHMMRTFSSVGSLPYTAPEILARVGHYTPVDLWSLGVVYLAMTTGENPWLEESMMGLQREILFGTIRITTINNLEIRRCIAGFLNRDPDKRHSFVATQTDNILQM